MPKLDELSPQTGGEKKFPEWDSEEELESFPKSKTTAVSVRRMTRGQEVFYDIRLYYYDRNDRRWKPTPKGLLLEKALAAKVINILSKELTGGEIL